jgi:hypothetical protein
MATNTSALKTFAQQTRIKLISLIKTKLQLVLNTDTSELRGYEEEIKKLRSKILQQGEDGVIEEVAYTWFNRMMALRFMDANGYNSPMIVTPAAGQTRPEVLQDAMSGNIDDELSLSDEDKLLPEAKLYRRLLIAVCNQKNHAMPFLFERIADYSELLLPDDLLSEQSFVTDIHNGMSDDDCQNVELMGWLYQFYIIDRKADAEIKKTKKGGLKSDEQAAATQLFTPHWVVRYMVENTLGKIWMTLHPESHLIDEMPYYIKYPEGQVDPIPEDISKASDIRFIDPCMGSGHVLVYAFDLFTKMYEEEGEMKKDIPNLILTNNIFGIDIDPRCYQLASFALTMKARAYYSRYLRHTVSPNVIALQNIDHDTIESTGNWPKDSLMWQFENVDTIGSLLKITPAECAAIKVDSGLFGANQMILKKQAMFLSSTYHCVVTNPPYLGKGFGDNLKCFLQKNYPHSKADTMVAFMERCISIGVSNGKIAMINLPSWMFISSFDKLRDSLLNKYHIASLIHMGRGIFGSDFGSVAFVFNKCKQDFSKGCYRRLFKEHVQVRSVEKIESLYLNSSYGVFFAMQSDFLKIPGTPIAYWVSRNLLNTFNSKANIATESYPKFGMSNGDGNLYVRQWSEVSNDKKRTKWFPYDKGGAFRRWYGNRDYYVDWENDGYKIKNNPKAAVRNHNFFFLPHFSWTLVSSGKFSSRSFNNEFILDTASNCIYFKNNKTDEFLLAFLNTKVCQEYLSLINPTINNSCGVVGQCPIIYGNKELIIQIVKNNISISRRDWDAHETSWDFQTSPLFDAMLGEIGISKSQFNHSRMIAEANRGVFLSEVCKTYCEQWQTLFMQLHANEEELNRQFIEIYGLQDELTPDVPFNEITILQKGEISIENNELQWHNDIIIKQFISYLVGCYMGRYSLDKPGLIIASQGQTLDSINPEVQKTLEIDDDGIIPFIQEPDFFADDMTERMQIAIRKLFGDANYYENLKFINDTLGCDLREYLFKTFYTDHVQMYQKRPIYWLFSSKMGDKKKKGYFKALVYMHRIEGDTLSKLHADYVHPYLEKVEMQLKEAEYQATRDDLSTAQRNKALKLVDELKDKVREVHAFEQQLVEMASHRMTIDLDDGVKANYPKYYPLVEPIKGLESSEE